MSVYKPKNSPFYLYDFRRGGRRFHGSNRPTEKRQAEAVERDEIKKAEAQVDKLKRQAKGR